MVQLLIKMKSNFNPNEELNRLSIWKDKACVLCGRKYPETILNIEGVIHHNGKLCCIDTKSCNKVRRKKNR